MQRLCDDDLGSALLYSIDMMWKLRSFVLTNVELDLILNRKPVPIEPGVEPPIW